MEQNYEYIDDFLQKMYSDKVGEKDAINMLDANAPGYLFELNKIINKGILEKKIETQVKDDLMGYNRTDEIYNDIKKDTNLFENKTINTDTRISSQQPSRYDEMSEINKNSERIERCENSSKYPSFDSSENRLHRYKKLKKIKRRRERELHDEKIKLLAYLDRMKAKGLRIKDLNTSDDFDDIRRETKRIREERKLKFGKDVFTHVFMGVITLIEKISKNIEATSGLLDGWSQNIKYRLDDYDDVIEDIVEKYSESEEDGGFSPELKLGFLVFMSMVEHATSNIGFSKTFGTGGSETKKMFGNISLDDNTEFNMNDEDLLREIENEKNMF